MSGIAAIYHQDGRAVAEDQIDSLIQAMAWRGGDQQGSWLAGPVGLGAVQVWTTPEDWGKALPLAAPSGCCITLDGRLDNRAEIALELGIPGNETALWSDAALLLRAYERWGEGCLERLAGAFAFAIWDGSRQQLFAARDPVGLRTLFYHWDGHNFYAASNLQQLRIFPSIASDLNKDYLWDYLTTTFTGTFDAEATPLQQIRRLPGGCWLTVGREGLRVERYWKPWELPRLEYHDSREYPQHFRAIFETVVEAHCRARGPVGAALSGGFDSSAVVCTARQLCQQGRVPLDGLHTFTLLFDEATRQVAGDLVNTSLLEAVLAKYGGEHHTLECSDWIPMYEELPYRGPVPQDEPFTIPSRPWRSLGAKIRQVRPDMRVLITGLGADEGLATSLFFVGDWLRQGKVRQALYVLKSIAASSHSSLGQVGTKLVLGGFLPRSLAYRLRQAQPGGPDFGLNMRYHFRIPRWLPDRRRIERRSLSRLALIPPNFTSVADQAPFERNTLLLGDNVRLWDDQYMGIAAGLELRHPFYDRRLLEFISRTPTAHRLGPRGTPKYLLRQSMAETVPQVQWRGDNGPGFLYIYQESINRQWPAIEQMFRTSRAAAAGFIDPGLYLEELGAKRNGRGNVSDTEVMSTLALEFWLRELEEPLLPLPISLSKALPVPAGARPA